MANTENSIWQSIEDFLVSKLGSWIVSLSAAIVSTLGFLLLEDLTIMHRCLLGLGYASLILVTLLSARSVRRLKARLAVVEKHNERLRGIPASQLEKLTHPIPPGAIQFSDQLYLDGIKLEMVRLLAINQGKLLMANFEKFLKHIPPLERDHHVRELRDLTIIKLSENGGYGEYNPTYLLTPHAIKVAIENRLHEIK